MAFAVKLLRGKNKSHSVSNTEGSSLDRTPSPCINDLNIASSEFMEAEQDNSTNEVPSLHQIGNETNGPAPSNSVIKRRFPVSIKSILEGSFRHLHHSRHGHSMDNSHTSGKIVTNSQSITTSKREKFHQQHSKMVEESPTFHSVTSAHVMSTSHSKISQHNHSTQDSLENTQWNPSASVISDGNKSGRQSALIDSSSMMTSSDTIVESRRRNMSAGAMSGHQVNQRNLTKSTDSPPSTPTHERKSDKLEECGYLINGTNHDHTQRPNDMMHLSASVNTPEVVVEDNYEDPLTDAALITGSAIPFCKMGVTNMASTPEKTPDPANSDQSVYSTPCRDETHVSITAISASCYPLDANSNVTDSGTLLASQVVNESNELEKFTKSEEQTSSLPGLHLNAKNSHETPPSLCTNNNEEIVPVPSEDVLSDLQKEEDLDVSSKEAIEAAVYDEAWDLKMNRRMGLALRSLTIPVSPTPHIANAGSSQTGEVIQPTKDGMYDYAYNRIWHQNKQMNLSSNLMSPQSAKSPRPFGSEISSENETIPQQNTFLPYMDQQTTGGSVCSVQVSSSSVSALSLHQASSPTVCITCSQIHEPSSQSGAFLCVPVPLSPNTNPSLTIGVLPGSRRRELPGPTTPIHRALPKTPSSCEGAPGDTQSFGYMESASIDEAISRYQNSNQSINNVANPYAADPISSSSMSSTNRRGITACNGCHINERTPLIQQRWYHGNASRMQAESVLGRFPDYSFLVRDSGSFPHEYSLSIRCGTSFLHMRISKIDSQQYVIGEHSQPFPNVPALIHHYCHRPLPIKDAKCIILGGPISVDQQQQQQQQHHPHTHLPSQLILSSSHSRNAPLVSRSISNQSQTRTLPHFQPV